MRNTHDTLAKAASLSIQALLLMQPDKRIVAALAETELSLSHNCPAEEPFAATLLQLLGGMPVGTALQALRLARLALRPRERKPLLETFTSRRI